MYYRCHKIPTLFLCVGLQVLGYLIDFFMEKFSSLASLSIKLRNLIDLPKVAHLYKWQNQVKSLDLGTSLVVHWLGRCAPNAGDRSLVTGWGARSLMPQLRVPTPPLKILQVTSKRACMLKLRLVQPNKKEIEEFTFFVLGRLLL